MSSECRVVLAVEHYYKTGLQITSSGPTGESVVLTVAGVLDTEWLNKIEQFFSDCLGENGKLLHGEHFYWLFNVWSTKQSWEMNVSMLIYLLYLRNIWFNYPIEWAWQWESLPKAVASVP